MKRNLRIGEGYAPARSNFKQQYIRYISLLAVLTSMCLYAVKQASAQVAEPAATAVADIKPLKIGDTIPEYLWHLPLQVVNHPEGKETITLNHFRDRKLIILDFWATWCGSCIATFPKLDNLKSRFPNQLQILPLTYEEAKVVRSSLKKIAAQINPKAPLLSITGDTVLRKSFEFRLIPHYVWISAEGKVITFSGADQLTAENISVALAGEDTDFSPKRDIKPDSILLMHEQLNKAPLLHYSILWKGRYESIRSGNRYTHAGDTLRGRALINMRLKAIYRIIARELFKQRGADFFTNRIRITLHNPELLNDYYNLQVVVPASDAANLYPAMLDDLNKYVGLHARVANRLTACYNLTQANNEDNREYPLSDIAYQPISRVLEFLNESGLVELPVVNVSGLDTPIAIDLDGITDGDTLRSSLAAVGIELKREERSLLLFIIEQK